MKELIGEIRQRIPDICLRTTLIAGFPGETRDDVEEVENLSWKNIGLTGWEFLPISMKKILLLMT